MALPGGDLNASYKLFEQGKLEETPVPEDKMKDVLGDPAKKRLLSDKPRLNTYYIALNVTEPPFDGPAVRKAFAMAIDRQALSITKGGTGRATNVIVPLESSVLTLNTIEIPMTPKRLQRNYARPSRNERQRNRRAIRPSRFSRGRKRGLPL